MDDVAEIGCLVPDQPRFAHPPQVPHVLPAVETITGDDAAQLASQRPGHSHRQQRVERQSGEMMSATRPDVWHQPRFPDYD